MTIHRKILTMPSVGSRETRDLRPILSGDVPSGINYCVLEYDETNSTCAVELWCSDHPILETAKRHGQQTLQAIAKRDYITGTMTKHPNKTAKIGRISITHVKTGPMAKGKPKAHLNKHVGRINETEQTVEWKGKRYGYLRKLEGTDTVGRKHDTFILDEG